LRYTRKIKRHTRLAFADINARKMKLILMHYMRHFYVSKGQLSGDVGDLNLKGKNIMCTT